VLPLARRIGIAAPRKKTPRTTAQIVSRWLSATAPSAQGTRASIQA